MQPQSSDLLEQVSSSQDPSRIAALLPAAGFGRRVGSPPAKELLPDEQGHPLIEWALSLCWQRSWTPVVITRPEKKELLLYLEKKAKEGLASEVVIVSDSLEWPDSVLKAEAKWKEKNLLILPDTRFSPSDVIDQIIEELDIFEGVFGTFVVENPRAWGTVCFGAPESRTLEICEKPARDKRLEGERAWGLIGCKKNRMRELFGLLLESTQDHLPREFVCDFKALEMQSFADITRGCGPFAEAPQKGN